MYFFTFPSCKAPGLIHGVLADILANRGATLDFLVRIIYELSMSETSTAIAQNQLKADFPLPAEAPTSQTARKPQA